MVHGLTLGFNFYLLLAVELISTPVVIKFRATIKKFRSNCPEMFLKIWKDLLENNCAGVSFLIKFLNSSLQLYSKRDSDTSYFPVNFVDF